MPGKKALMVIDVVNSFCNESHTRIRQMVPYLVSFVDEFRNRSLGPIIFVKCVPWDREHVADNIKHMYPDPDSAFYFKNMKGEGEEFYLLRPEKTDHVITKDTYDAFSNPDLERILKEKGIREIVVAGIQGDVCVNATLQSGFSKGYSFTVIEDLVETIDHPDRQNLQNLLKKYTWPQMIGQTVTSKEFHK